MLGTRGGSKTNRPIDLAEVKSGLVLDSLARLKARRLDAVHDERQYAPVSQVTNALQKAGPDARVEETDGAWAGLHHVVQRVTAAAGGARVSYDVKRAGGDTVTREQLLDVLDERGNREAGPILALETKDRRHEHKRLELARIDERSSDVGHRSRKRVLAWRLAATGLPMKSKDDGIAPARSNPAQQQQRVLVRRVVHTVLAGTAARRRPHKVQRPLFGHFW